MDPPREQNVFLDYWGKTSGGGVTKFSRERIQLQNLSRTERTSQVASKNILYVLASDYNPFENSGTKFFKNSRSAQEVLGG